jgi:hypothetical protein
MIIERVLFYLERKPESPQPGLNNLRISGSQNCYPNIFFMSSVYLYYTSVADPRQFGTDPDPDLRICASD